MQSLSHMYTVATILDVMALGQYSLQTAEPSKKSWARA